MSAQRPSEPPVPDATDRSWLIAGALGLLLVTGLMAIRWWVILSRPDSEAHPTRVVVLSLDSRVAPEAADTDVEREAGRQAGLLVRAIARELGRTPGLRAAVGGYPRSGESPRPGLRQVGAELGAAYVLAGEIYLGAPSAPRAEAHLAFRLVRVADGVELWAEVYDRAPAGLSNLASELSAPVSAAITADLERSEVGG